MNKKHLLPDLIFLLVGLIFIVSVYDYQPQIISFWNSGIASGDQLSVSSWNSLSNFWNSTANNSAELSANAWNSYSNLFQEVYFPALSLNFDKIFGSGKATPTVVNHPVAVSTTPQVAVTKNCGTSVSPQLDAPASYENNSVLACLGASALNCQTAIGNLQDNFFPTNFEITQSTTESGSCNFKLSYPLNSTLTDVTGKKLAGQFITCPLDIVEAIDNTNPANPKYVAPTKTDLSKYAGQIYLYGTLGLFVENNLDQNKIQALGCSGGYIGEAIASYNNVKK